MRAVTDMVAALARAGHRVVVLTHIAKDVPQEWRTGGAGQPVLVELPPRVRFGLIDQRTREIVAEHVKQADVVHMHTPWEPSNLQVGPIARRAGVPYVVSVHGMLDDWSMGQHGTLKKKLFLAIVGKRHLERAAFIHCTAQAELDQAKRWFPRGHGCVIPLVFDLEPYRELPGLDLAKSKFSALSRSGAKILFLSRLHPVKRVELVIDAAILLRQRGVEFTLVIAGTGDDGYVLGLKQRAESLGDDVSFVGLVAGREKVSLYQSADVTVVPSEHENFGMVFPESLACRTAVVTTKGVSIWAELERCGGAKIVEPDAHVIADTLQGLLADLPKLQSMGERGREWAFSELDGDRVAQRYVALYRDAIERSPHSRPHP